MAVKRSRSHYSTIATPKLSAFRAISFIFLVIIWSAFSASVSANGFNKLFIQEVMVCYDKQETQSIGAIPRQNCKKTTLGEVEPNNSLTWIVATFDLDTTKGINKPLGLFFSAKAAAEFYLNGELIGRNGYPSVEKKGERAGAMDSVIYIPLELIKKQQNELVIKLSAHHGIVNLGGFIQRAIITHYDSPQNMVLRHYLPSLLPLGVLVIGLIFSSTLAALQSKNQRNVLLPLFTLFVVLQLLTEVSRGLIPYDYSYHDIRLLFILLLGTLSGQCLLLHIVKSFLTKAHRKYFFLSMLLTLVGIYLGESMESKTVIAIQVPAWISFIIAAYQAFQKNEAAARSAIALLVFSSAIAIQPDKFLDIYFYYFVASLLLFFFIQHAIAYKTERSLKLVAQSRAERLQQALDEYNELQQPSKIQINNGQKVEWTSCDYICCLKGARDYVEIMMSDNRCILHNQGLAVMEEKLPATFLRVHRSFIVNKRFIQSLEKLPSGGGNLILTTGVTVPVSRRIMPKVKSQLT
ncbi:LytR/AlgR family response regulator transcription factor [Pseudoalteromonas luteoviolacea]|uniref:LytR/AlgR family response regulator transcription factor n=1 Tax=Pseudoalteromonas luteoviolacea TaxID=43657 RepID=UPI00155B16DA|nr:LytTR family DNA-binding domain-containing protein [Pseudoalteromonas luteoviolacea]